MPDKVLLKDLLFNKEKIEQIAREIHAVYPAFKKEEFTAEVLKKFPELELKARITWIARCLKNQLPGNYAQAVAILVKALPSPNDPHQVDNDFGDFVYAAYTEYVAKNGCSAEHLEVSLAALYEMTQRFSAEDAIRYFLNAFPEITVQRLLVWTNDSHYHVRRLCSEGTRPKLPWSQKINLPVAISVQLLNRLFADPTRYVTRSVANHVNDISKMNPDLAVDTLIAWKKSKKQQPKEMEYIIRHSLRTLVKQGDDRALALLGFSASSEVSLTELTVPKIVRMNTPIQFSFVLTAKDVTDVIIDYIVYFQNKSGKLANKKVFKLTSLRLYENKPVSVSKTHMLRQHMTTRTLYPGEHELEIQVNGNKLAKKTFLLE